MCNLDDFKQDFHANYVEMNPNKLIMLSKLGIATSCMATWLLALVQAVQQLVDTMLA